MGASKLPIDLLDFERHNRLESPRRTARYV